MSGTSTAPLHFRVEPAEKDWVSANRLMLRHRWLWRRLVLSFLTIWLVYSAILIAVPTIEYGWHTRWALYHLSQAGVYAVIVVAVLIPLVLALLPRRVRKQLAETRRLSSGADVEFDEHRVRFATGIADVRLAWAQFKRWHENADVLVLAITDREALLLPKSQLDPSLIDAVRAHLVAAQVERGLT